MRRPTTGGVNQGKELPCRTQWGRLASLGDAAAREIPMRSIALFRIPCLVLNLAIWSAQPVASAELRLIAPSAPGSGWDLLAQAAKAALADEPDSPDVVVSNVPGGGGTVGLGQFLTESSDTTLLLTGLTMLEATIVNRSPVALDRLTPVARLSADPFAVVVPVGSPIASLRDLAAAMKADPTKISWAGGPARGVDHVAAILFVRAIGLDMVRVNYVPFLTSAEAATAVGEDHVTAAILPTAELDAELKTGRLKVLAVTGAGRSDAIDAPTLGELDVPLELVNWRGLMARPGLGTADRDRLAHLAQVIAASPRWREAIVRKGWQSAYLDPEAFTRFLRGEQVRLKEALKGAGLLKPQSE